jgi:uncharacterized protein (TIGR00730 family)
MIRNVCVFCGSSVGSRPEYAAAAESVGRVLARRGIGLVYGGGNIGIMGVLARAALAEGGKVLGIIPQKLYEVVSHVELTELIVVKDMHERKARMAAASDAFIALPGGVGTFEELFEVWAWRHIGFHSKPVGLLEVAGFYAPMLTFLQGVVDEGFIKEAHLTDLIVDEDPDRLLDRLATKGPPVEIKTAEFRG